MDAVMLPILNWLRAHGEDAAIRGKSNVAGPLLGAQLAQWFACACVPQENSVPVIRRSEGLTIGGKGETKEIFFLVLPQRPARGHVPQLEIIVELNGDRLAIGGE